jgi:hypothetical protein
LERLNIIASPYFYRDYTCKLKIKSKNQYNNLPISQFTNSPIHQLTDLPIKLVVSEWY